MGLVLGQKIGEVIHIGKDIKLTLLSVKGNQVKVDINAPQSVSILRDEVKKRNESNEQHRRI